MLTNKLSACSDVLRFLFMADLLWFGKVGGNNV